MRRDSEYPTEKGKYHKTTCEVLGKTWTGCNEPGNADMQEFLTWGNDPGVRKAMQMILKKEKSHEATMLEKENSHKITILEKGNSHNTKYFPQQSFDSEGVIKMCFASMQ